MKRTILSEALINFFGVEIRNIGGVQPATLSSALDSWRQADDGTRESWSGTSGKPKILFSLINTEIRKLITRYGRNMELQTLIDMQPPLKKYRVPVCRIGYGHADIEVTARNDKEAEAKAIEKAGNHLFSENSSEYTCPDGAIEIKWVLPIDK
jgi:hypothetical protein